jgi:hypothetical protein
MKSLGKFNWHLLTNCCRVNKVVQAVMLLTDVLLLYLSFPPDKLQVSYLIRQ